jgi:hypothetical protein
VVETTPTKAQSSPGGRQKPTRWVFVLFAAVISFAKTSSTEENPPFFMTFVHPAIGH